MQDLGIIGDEEMEEQYYRILDTQGDVTYAQAIDPQVALLSFDGHTVQQVLSSCAADTTAAPSSDHLHHDRQQQQQHLRRAHDRSSEPSPPLSDIRLPPAPLE